MSTKAIPDGYDSLIPHLMVRDAARAIEFYKNVFGATEKMRMPTSDGKKIGHAELQIRNSVFMLADECPQMGAPAPQPGSTPSSGVMVYLADVDAVFAKAVSLGAKPVMPPADMFWGDRMCKFIDPFGHQWAVATHTRDVSPQEIAEAAAKWSKTAEPANA